MTNILVDPYILALPDSNNNIDFEDYLTRLLEIKSLIDDQFNLYISNKTINILIDNYNYPDAGILNSFINQFGLRGTYQSKDIMSTIDKILKCTSFEDKLEIKEILYDNVIVEPNEIENNQPTVYQEELRRLLMFICIANDMEISTMLATYTLSQTNICVTGEIIDIEGTVRDSSKLVKRYSKEVNTFGTIQELYSRLDPIFIWKSSESIKDYEFAVNIFLFQRINGFYLDKKWIFGKHFFDNMKTQGFLHEESKIKALLRAITDTILEEDLRKTHALRDGAGGNESQITRNNDKAWRRDIDREYHLHYWECNGYYEFALSVVHNDMKIPK